MAFGSDSDWIERIRAGGAVPCLDPANCLNGWASPPADTFMVRGPDYLSTKVKIPCQEYLLRPLGYDWLRGSAKISEVLKNPKHRVRSAIDSEVAKGNKPFVWAFNIQLPSNDNYSAILYFAQTGPVEEGSLMDRFINGDEAFRKSRLKFIANIVKGPWIVKTAVGEQAICLIGRAVYCKYIIEENFFEVDVDIGSSIVANAIVHLAISYITNLTVDLAFLIESQTESELPEKLLGAVRVSELSLSSAQEFEMPTERPPKNSSQLLSTRLFNSFKLAIPQMLYQSNARESASSSEGSRDAQLSDDADGAIS